VVDHEVGEARREMKVLYLAPTPERATGAFAYTFLDEEAHALRAAGVQVYVLATHGEDRDEQGLRVRVLPPGRRLSERIRTPGFLLRHRAAFPPRMSVRDWVKAYHLARIERFAATLVRDEDITLIHSQFAWPGGVGGAMAAAETGRPLIASFCGMDLDLHAGLGYGDRQDPFTEHAILHLLRSAERTTYVSNFMRNLGLALGAEPSAAVTILVGVDLDRFTPASDRVALRSRLGIRSSMLLSVGGLQKLKGVNHVLEALATLRSRHDFTYVIVGDGEESRNLRTLARELELEDRVVFCGRLGREEVPQYFSACDLFILGSLTEGSGNVLLEAMSSGRPVICTDSGGPPEYVLHGRTGFVVPVGDVQAMAERIRQLLDKPELADSLGEAGRTRMVEGFAYSRKISEILALYESVVRTKDLVQGAPPAPHSGRIGDQTSGK
jgi:glycosyltransferase involved in cell wall biosynthesis